MNWRQYALLFLVGLAVPFAVSRFQSLPGYMDADYYFAGGVELARGNGFTEPYLWNYLDDPQGLPHPSHTYWMPLASIVSALGMWLAGATTYAAGRLPFILLSACVPLLTLALAFDLSRDRRLALVSGLLSVFSIYYAPFMPVPDNYALFMLLGGTFLLLAPRQEKWIPLALGAISGLMTLSRSDGLLWLGLAGLTVLWKYSSPYSPRTLAPGASAGVNTDEKDAPFIKKSAFIRVHLWLKTVFSHFFKERGWVRVIPAGFLVLLGYLLVMGGWHIRNYNLFSSLMAPVGGRLLWLESYNQTFSYPASSITRENFLAAGWSAALDDRLTALSFNAGTLFGAQGGIFLFPFILVGLWSLRGDLRTRIAVTGWLLLLLVMTVIFPFAGPRGSFFHAGAAFQPYWWALAPIGLNLVIQSARERGLFADNAYLVFQGMLVVLAALMTWYMVDLRLRAIWGDEADIYARVEQRFLAMGISPQVGVIVRNPPGYYISSGRPAIALPYGSLWNIVQVAERYGAPLLVLEKGGTFEAVQGLYDDPQGSAAFVYLGEVDEAKLYRIVLDP